MRLTDFWERMDSALGPGYSHSWAADQVLADLGHRTVSEALTAGDDPKVVWRAVVVHLGLPASMR